MENNDGRKILLGLSHDELKAVVRDLGMPSFTAGQILKWLYQQHVLSIDEMTNISKTNRERLKEHFVVGAMAPIDSQHSSDGTIKYLFPVCCHGMTTNGAERFVETVFIPDGERATLCVSSQVGCKMNCLFCQTGKQGFEGNLTAGDILNQIDALPERERLFNDSYCWLEAWNQSIGIDEYFGRKGKFKNGVIAGTVRWEDMERRDADQRLFDEDKHKPVNGALLRLYNGRGVLSRIYTLDNRDNGVFVFTNLPKDKYKLELYYGNEDLYITTKIKANKNQTSYKKLTLKRDQKPKKKKH